MVPLHAVVMGVAGCGKSLVGTRLAAALDLPLIEGDDFHPAGNIAKMRQGIPLEDADRAEWLRVLALQLRAHPGGAVLTCSALKRSYRETLRGAVSRLHFIHLSLTPHQALERVASRTDHFYPPSLVASQFEALEPPQGEPGVFCMDASAHVDRLVGQAADWLRAQRALHNP